MILPGRAPPDCRQEAAQGLADKELLAGIAAVRVGRGDYDGETLLCQLETPAISQQGFACVLRLNWHPGRVGADDVLA